MPVSSHILSDISLGFCAIIFYANKGHFYLSQFPALFFFFFQSFSFLARHIGSHLYYKTPRNATSGVSDGRGNVSGVPCLTRDVCPEFPPSAASWPGGDMKAGFCGLRFLASVETVTWPSSVPNMVELKGPQDGTGSAFPGATYRFCASRHMRLLAFSLVLVLMRNQGYIASRNYPGNFPLFP